MPQARGTRGRRGTVRTLSGKAGTMEVTPKSEDTDTVSTETSV